MVPLAQVLNTHRTQIYLCRGQAAVPEDARQPIQVAARADVADREVVPEGVRVNAHTLQPSGSAHGLNVPSDVPVGKAFSVAGAEHKTPSALRQQTEQVLAALGAD